jgi:hypothetical protein
MENLESKKNHHKQPKVSAGNPPAPAHFLSIIVAVPRRVRDRTHVKAVAEQPCLICGRQPSDAHYLRFAQHPALGRKVGDEFFVAN